MRSKVLVRKLTGVLLAVILLCQMAIPAFADSRDAAGKKPLLAQTTAATQTMPFSDMVSEDSWSYKALTVAVEAGLLKGTNGRLNPYGKITRAEMITIVLRALGLDDSKGRDLTAFEGDVSQFKDVRKSDWYFDEIAMAYRLKLLNGTSEDEMSPNAVISREQAITILCRLMGLNTSGADMPALRKFSDASSLSAWARPYAGAMAAAGYISGSAGVLNPKGNITRQEFAQLMYNLFGRNYISEQKDADAMSGQTVSGNLIVSGGDITLTGLTVNGDVLIGDGVGNANAALDGVKISGRLIVRGGGDNSIHLNNTTAGAIIIEKLSDGSVKIYGAGGASVDYMEIPDGNDTIVIDCDVNELTVSGSDLDIVVGGKINNLTVSGDRLSVSGGGSVNSVVLETGVNTISLVVSYTKIYNNTLQTVTVAGKDGKTASVSAGTTAGAGAAEEDEAAGEDEAAPSKPTYSVVFHSDGGGDFTPLRVSEGSSSGRLPLPYKENMIFMGWFKDNGTFEDIVTENTPINSNTDLYAHFAAASDAPPESYTPTATSVMDADPDYAITVLSSDASIDAGEVKSAIAVVTEDDANFAGITVTGRGGSYTVTATEGYTPGFSYALTLNDDALTFKGKESTIRTCYVTIKTPPPVLNLRLNSDVKAIPAEDISNVTENGNPVDSIFAPLYDVDKEDATEIAGSFVYSGGLTLSLGDKLAIYEGTPPDERVAGVDYYDENIAYVNVTGKDGNTISYSKADPTEILFMPDVLPVKTTDDTDGDENNFSVTIDINKLTYNDVSYAELRLDSSVIAIYAEMGLDSATVIEAGDYLAFYEGALNDDTVISGYAEITGVTVSGVNYILAYTPVTEDKLLSSMDMSSSQELTYERLTENTNQSEIENTLRRQFEESGFTDAAAGYLVQLAYADPGTREQVVGELGIENFSITRSEKPVLLSSSSKPEVHVDIRIGSGTSRYGSGFSCRVTVTCDVDIGDNVSLTITGTFVQELRADLTVVSHIFYKRVAGIPIPNEYHVYTSIDVYTFTFLSLNALLTTDDGVTDLNIKDSIKNLQNTGSGTADSKSAEVRRFYEIYRDMLAQEHEFFELFSVPIFRISGSFDPLHIIAFGLKGEFVISLDADVSLGAEFSYEKAIRYTASLYLFARSAETNHYDLIPETVLFTVYAMGVLGVRGGIKLTAEVGLLDVSLDSIGFSAEVGAYWKIWGFIYYYFCQTPTFRISTYGGTCYMELGIYLEIDFLAQLGNGALSYEKTLYEHYWPLLTIGDRYYVYNFNYSLDDGSDDIYLKGDAAYYQIPSSAFIMSRMDLKTGQISETAYSPSDFYYTVKDDNYHAFSVSSPGVITVTRPVRSDIATAKLTVTLKGRPLSFTSAPISRTFNLTWDDVADSYIIHLNSNDGIHAGSMNLPYGSPISLPTPTRAGYSFAGWYTDTSLTQPFNATTMPPTDVWLFAKWTPIPSVGYAVRHYLQSLDGSSFDLAAAERYYALTESSVTPAVTSFTGFTPPGRETVTVAGDGSTAVEYYYTRNTYTATFTWYDGTINHTLVVPLKFGAEGLQAPSVSIPGAIFTGWSRTSSYMPPEVPTIMPAQNIGYLANWSAINYSITYDLQGGSVSPPNPISYNFNNNSFGTILTNPTKAGCFFAGWTGTGLTSPTRFVKIEKGSTGDRYYTAVWQVTYTIRHWKENLDGSYTQSTTTETQFGYSGELTRAGPLLITGYTAKPILQKPIAPDVSTVVDVYYDRNSYTVNFDANGGQGGASVRDVKWGSNIPYALAPEVTREGYTFSGWSGADVMPRNDTTVTAQWTPVDYAITYNLAGGGATGSNPASYTIESADITLSEPTRYGYDFAGWTEESGGMLDADDVAIPHGSYGDKTFTARWTEASGYHNLVADANGGTGGVTLRYMSGETINLPEVTRTGYKYEYWLDENGVPYFPDENGRPFYDDGTERIEIKMPEHDWILRPEWYPISYTVELDSNGVSADFCKGDNNIICWYDTPGHLPFATDDFGYPAEDLAGWNTMADGTGISYDRGGFVYNLADTDEASITLYAQWLPYHKFGIFSTYYAATQRVFGLDENGEAADAALDASTSDKPVLNLDYLYKGPFDNAYFRVKKTGDADNPIALYIYDPDGRPLVPGVPEEGSYESFTTAPAPEGSLIGSGSNNGLTAACKQSFESLYGVDWAEGLVTVGKITALADINTISEATGDDNFGFIFTSVNGVSYLICGKHAEYGVSDYTVTNPAPIMGDVDAVDYFDSGNEPTGIY